MKKLFSPLFVAVLGAFRPFGGGKRQLNKEKFPNNQLKYTFLLIVFIFSVITGALLPRNASAFSGGLQDLPFCKDDTSSGISMPYNFPYLTGTDATFAYGSISEFDPQTSSYYIGFDPDFWDASYEAAGYQKLMIWYTDRDANTESGLRLDYNNTTGQSSIGIYNNASTPNNEVKFGILYSSIEGSRFVGLGSATGTAWGQREALSCFEYQTSQAAIDYTESYSETFPPIDADDDKEIRRADFTYSVNDKNISAKIKTPVPDLPDFTPELSEDYYFVGYYANYTLGKCNLDFNEISGICEGEYEVIDTKFRALNEDYNYTVNDYGKYTLDVNYAAMQCYRYPSYPTTPDYCIYTDLRAVFNKENFDYINAFKNINVTGKSIAGDTSTENCTNSGYCGADIATNFEECMQEAFPFFDMQKCTKSINDLVKLLTFQMANPANQAVVGVATNANPNSCYIIQTLDDWLNIPNQQACPAFSSEIRNTITPFITFILGGFVFYWITRGRGVNIQ